MPLPEDAWDAAWKKVRPALVMLARQRLPRRLWSKVEPSDIVQITLKEAHERRAQFNGDSVDTLLAWLHPMLVHRMIDQIRHYNADRNDVRRDTPLMRLISRTTAQLKTELVCGGASPSQAMMKRELVLRLGRALEELPEDQRLVVELHHLQGLKLSEVASVLERTTSAVAALLHRGLEKLRGALKGAV